MKAVRFHNHGGAEVLRYEDAPEPTPKPTEVKLKVKAVALNHLDIWLRKGLPGVKVPFQRLEAATSPARWWHWARRAALEWGPENESWCPWAGRAGNAPRAYEAKTTSAGPTRSSEATPWMAAVPNFFACPR